VKKERKYNRVLLKLSGEALTGNSEFGIDPKMLDRIAAEVGQLVELGVQIGMVIGGGNLFRGARLHAGGHACNSDEFSCDERRSRARQYI